MEMIRPVLALSVMFFAFLLTPVLALAQSADQILDFIWVRTFKFERQWLYTPNLLIVNAILPTIAVYAIFLGLMRTLRIFEGMGNMEHVIALVVTFSGLFLGWISWVAGALAFLGVWSVGIFILVFFVGSILYTRVFFGRFRRSPQRDLEFSYKRSIKHVSRELDNVRQKIKVLEEEKFSHPDRYSRESDYAGRLANLLAKEKKFENQLKEINEAFNKSVT